MSKSLFISADIEGVAGVVSQHQTRMGHFEFETARRWMTEEVLAVISAATDCGIGHFVVADSHGSGQNLLLDQLPDSVEVVRSWSRPLMMMQGLESANFEGAVLLGYHGPAHQVGASLGHTLFLEIRALRLNGVLASETTLSAATAGHFNVPVILASGDDKYCAHVRETLPQTATVETGVAYGWLSKRTYPRNFVCEKLSQVTKDALSRPAPMPFLVSQPIEVTMDLTTPILAETLSYLPFVERMDSHTVRFSASDIVELNSFMAFFYDILVTRWRL